MKTTLRIENIENVIKDIQSLDTDLILLLTDHNVWTKYSKIFPIDKIEGKRVILWKAPDGEKTKTIAEFESCTEFLLDKGIHRKAHLLAFGGGALSDFAGFIASTILRGVQWSVVPSSLLSMVDASIGGKVAINSKEAKNLIGAFHKPRNVWICEKFLETLPVDEMESGKGEILKYCFLNKAIYELVESEAPLSSIIEACAKYKMEITEEDFKENSRRKILNLGHTFGHAIEKIYGLSHGVSVFWGMALIFKIFGSEGHAKKLKMLRSKIKLPDTDSPWINRGFPVDKIIELIQKDKKMASNNTLEIVLVHEPGQPYTQEYTLDALEELLEKNKDGLKQFTI